MSSYILTRYIAILETFIYIILTSVKRKELSISWTGGGNYKILSMYSYSYTLGSLTKVSLVHENHFENINLLNFYPELK